MIKIICLSVHQHTFPCNLIIKLISNLALFGHFLWLYIVFLLFTSLVYVTGKNKIKCNQNHNFKHGSTGMDAREVLTQTRLTLYKAG